MSYADVNGLSLYYEEHGAGEPLVLLHGGFGAAELFGSRSSPRWPPDGVSSPSTCRVTATPPTSIARCARSTWPTTSRRSSRTSASSAPT